MTVCLGVNVKTEVYARSGKLVECCKLGITEGQNINFAFCYSLALVFP